MGLRGPVPRPTQMLVLNGSAAAARREGEPQPEIVEPECPAWLTERAREEWRRIAPELVKLKCLTRSDQAALALYCQAIADVEELREVLGKEGWTLTTPQGVKKHPAASAYNEACTRVRAFSLEFGLTPSARTRIKVDAKKSADPLGDFVRRKKGKAGA
jgi:P27 family predicted phage terminase small subunit